MNRHVTAESLYAQSSAAGEKVSLATVYNTLRAFCDAGWSTKSWSTGPKAISTPAPTITPISTGRQPCADRCSGRRAGDRGAAAGARRHGGVAGRRGDPPAQGLMAENGKPTPGSDPLGEKGLPACLRVRMSGAPPARNPEGGAKGLAGKMSFRKGWY